MRENGREKLNELARRVFEPRARHPLHAEDLREIRKNLTGFFGILRSWAAAEENGQLTTQEKSAAGLDKHEA